MKNTRAPTRQNKALNSNKRASAHNASIEADFKEAYTAQQQFEGRGGNSSDPTGPLFRWNARLRLEMLREQYDGGDKGALLAAIRKCANHDLVMPDWVARGFISGYDKVLNCRVKSWDEAFGRPFPKGANLNALRKRRQKSVRVFNEVRRRHHAGESIGKELFDDVGRSLNISGSTARDYYYRWAPAPSNSSAPAPSGHERPRVTKTRPKRL